MFDEALISKTQRFLESAEAQGVRVICAESCTGGLLGALLTHSAGASAVMEASLVTYSNEAKAALLGVEPSLLARHGAVSPLVAKAMAEGALERSPEAALSVSITGIAGPDGGTEHKPVGLVHFACAARARETVQLEKRFGEIGRAEVRIKSAEAALDMLSDGLDRLRG